MIFPKKCVEWAFGLWKLHNAVGKETQMFASHFSTCTEWFSSPGTWRQPSCQWLWTFKGQPVIKNCKRVCCNLLSHPLSLQSSGRLCLQLWSGGQERKEERKQALKPETRSQAEADSQPRLQTLGLKVSGRENSDILTHCNSSDSGEFAKIHCIQQPHRRL